MDTPRTDGKVVLGAGTTGVPLFASADVGNPAQHIAGIRRSGW